jgi:hypothetical protein
MDRTRDIELKGEPMAAFKTYPKNSMIPAIVKRENNSEIVSMIIIADGETLSLINGYKDERLDIQVTTYLEDINDGMGKNLVIRFDIFYPHAHSLYEGVVHDEPKGQQRDFIKALENSKVIDLVVTDENRKVHRVIPVEWDYDKSKNVFDRILH